MNRIFFKKRIQNWLLALSVALSCLACDPSYVPNSHFLIKDEPEKFGFGLYSYLLLNPNQNDSLKSEILIETFLSKRTELVEISKFRVDSDINIIYLPLKNDLPNDFDQFSNEKQVHWVMKNYNFERAETLIKKFQFEHASGPYVISFPQPVSVKNDAIRNNFLVQDFTKVPPSAAAIWLDEFMKQSYQNDFRNSAGLKLFCDTLKAALSNTINFSEFNKSVPVMEENLNEWIFFR